MKSFIVLFREPDGRTERHSEEFTKQHQLHWKQWMEKWGAEGRLAGGSSLSMLGKIISEDKIEDGIHQSGTEIVGGFLLINAEDLEEAAAIVQSCPIFESGGYAELRELQ